MNEVQTQQAERRVLVLLPTSPDAAATQDLLTNADIACQVCNDLPDLCAQLRIGAGAVLVAAETLVSQEAGLLVELLCEQPPWSDIPILLLTHAGLEPSQVEWTTSLLNKIILLDWPAHEAVLLSAIRAALRDRERQYEMRDYLARRDQDEQAIRESESRFRAFFDLAAVGIGEADTATGQFTCVNERFCQITGYSRDELLSMDISQLTYPEDRTESLRQFQRLMRGEIDEYSLEKRYVRKDGQVIWVSLHGTALRDSHGRPLVSFGVVQDITERKHAEQAVQQERRFLRKVIDAAPSLVFVKDRQGRFVLCNEELARSYGTTLDVVQGKTDADFTPLAEEVAHFRHDDLEVMDTQRPKLIREEAVTYAEGHKHWLRTVKVPLVNEDGTCDQVLGVAADITELKRAEEQLRTLNATLEERVAQRTAEAQHRAEQLSALAAELTLTEQRERQRLAEILHDHLQQLLVGARFSISLLRGRADIPQLQPPLRQVADLLDDSLRTSRSLTAELSPPVLRQGTLADVLRWLANWMWDKHGLRVHLKLDEQINPPAEEIRLLLFQAARELLFNIVKHAGVDQACLEMVRLDSERLRITIADAGRGFDPAGPQPKAPAESGFGLFSIRERLHLLGGHMEIQSALGHGTRAILIAPLQVNKDVAAEAPASVRTICPLSPPVPSSDRGRIRVLLADDHQVVRDGLAQLLQTCEGIEVVAQASDGQEAVELARQARPDVVVMDVSMPRLGGIDATRQMVAELPDTQVIGLSMHTEPNVARAMAAAGAAAYLPKSAPPDSLVAAIQACKPAG